MSERGNFEGGQNLLGWQRERRVPNLNENRVAKDDQNQTFISLEKRGKVHHLGK